MKSIIICEGRTDLTLIQYFMEKANGWNYAGRYKMLPKFNFAHELRAGSSTLVIGEAGGCGNIGGVFQDILEINMHSPDASTVFNNVVIICDRDEVGSEDEFIGKLTKCLQIVGIDYELPLKNDEWLQCTVLNPRHEYNDFRILLLIIPFEDTGALETFLLNAIAENDEYDKRIIDNGNRLVETIDNESRYLCHRRHITKAKFNVYFSIRTPYEQFQQRQDILRGVPWERFEMIQSSFTKLRDLNMTREVGL